MFEKKFINERMKDWKAYLELVRKVEKIDAEAAIYLLTEAYKLPTFVACGELSYCFTWLSSEQGGAFWVRINKRLKTAS